MIQSISLGERYVRKLYIAKRLAPNKCNYMVFCSRETGLSASGISRNADQGIAKMCRGQPLLLTAFQNCI